MDWPIESMVAGSAAVGSLLTLIIQSIVAALRTNKAGGKKRVIEIESAIDREIARRKKEQAKK